MQPNDTHESLHFFIHTRCSWGMHMRACLFLYIHTRALGREKHSHILSLLSDFLSLHSHVLSSTHRPRAFSSSLPSMPRTMLIFSTLVLSIFSTLIHLVNFSSSLLRTILTFSTERPLLSSVKDHALFLRGQCSSILIFSTWAKKGESWRAVT